MNKSETIITEFIHPWHDWIAFREDYDTIKGTGETELEAIQDLFRLEGNDND